MKPAAFVYQYDIHVVAAFLISGFFVCLFSPSAYNSMFVAVSEEELSFSLPGPHVQRRASGEAAFPSEDSNRVRKIVLS